MTIEAKFVFSICLILLSTVAGYLARQRGFLKEKHTSPIMTVVAVAGYPSVGFLAIWKISLQWSDAWLPALGGLQAILMALLALWVARWLFADKVERGLLGFSCGIGNHGVTMAGFVVFLLYGDRGLGLNTLYAVYTFFALVLLSYTIAQAYSPDVPRQPIFKLMAKNLLHWRAMGLYTCTAAILLTSLGVRRPAVFDDYPIIDFIVYLLIIIVYFSIGLRLHLPHLLETRKAIISLIVIRHGVGLLIGLGLAGVTMLTPWPLTGLAWKVLVIQSSVPMGVMGVAVANMFHLKPQEASALFVVSSAVYLLLGIPLVMWIFG